MGTFKKQKRVYTPILVLRDIGFMLRNMRRFKAIKRSQRVSDAFAEKIMLTVTGVNECVHCARVHTAAAQKSGVELAEIQALLSREINTDVQDYEYVALNFAQHYAQTDRNPDAEIKQELYNTYGNQIADDIITYIRGIYFGNLFGNTLDAFKGRFKGDRPENSYLLSELFVFVVAAIFLVPTVLLAKIAKLVSGPETPDQLTASVQTTPAKENK